MSVLSELRPNKNLLDSDFEGYKVSLDPIPMKRSIFGAFINPVTIHQASASDSQISVFHSKLFDSHNHLHRDPWKNEVYFINQHRKIQKGIDMLNVWKVPETRPSKPGDYNMSIYFPSKEYAVLSDGAGMLYLLYTSHRSQPLYWKSVFSGVVCGEDVPFMVVHSVEVITPACVEYHCLLHHISEEEIEGIVVYLNILYWIVLLPDEKKEWTMKSKYKLSSSGDFDYAAIEPTGRGIYVVSNKPFNFVEINGNSIETVKSEKEHRKKEPPLYFWKQTKDYVTVWLTVDSEDFKIIVEPLHLSITCGNKELLAGETSHIVEPDLATWSHKEGKLEVCLTKFDAGLIWKELLVNNKRGEEVLEEQLANEIDQWLADLCSDREQTVSYSSFNNQPLEESDACPESAVSYSSFNNQPLEESDACPESAVSYSSFNNQPLEESDACPESSVSYSSFNNQQLDESDASPESAVIAVRLDLDTLAPSHKITLGESQWCFNTQLKPESVPALCLRHEPDGCLWQPKVPNPGDTEWKWSHIWTFNTLGTIQTSSSQRKFTLCPPNMSYAAICDTKTHIYIFRKPHAVNGELRNRHTGKRVKRVATRQIINLDIHSNILGACASDKSLHILTDDTLYCASMEILNFS